MEDESQSVDKKNVQELPNHQEKGDFESHLLQSQT